MKARRFVALAALLVAGCTTAGDDGQDKDRSKAEERARHYCVTAAKSRGLRVDSVGKIEKLGKKQYEVRLHIDPRKQDGKKKDDFRVVCRYDDKSRSATIEP